MSSWQAAPFGILSKLFLNSDSKLLRNGMMRQIPVVTLIVLLMGACHGMASIDGPGPTPDVNDYGDYSYGEAQPSAFPRWLNCSFITSTSPGPTIGGLQIGVSTFEEVKERIVYTALYWDREHGHVRIEGDKSLSVKDWRGITQTCFVGNRLSAISPGHRDPGTPSSLDEWLDTYGPPDLVTWGSSYGQRSMIWAEEGILTELDLYFELSGRLILFSPISVEKLEESWLLDALPQAGQECPESRDEVSIDTGCFPLEMEVPDPLGLGTLSN